MSKLNIDQQTIKELFTNKRADFLIPDYQRPYAWDISECQFVKAQITIELLKSKIDFRKKDTEKTVKKWLNKLEIE